MLNLLVKDFRMLFSGKMSKGKKVFATLIMLIGVAVIMVAETFLFSAILEKIKVYKNAPYAFMVLFLVIVSIMMAISGIFQAKKLFFNEIDLRQLSIHPISSGMQIASKLIFLFLLHYASSFIFVFPLFISYGAVFGGTVMFYYAAVFYPVASFVFEIGVALVFVYPVWYFMQFLKKHVVLEFSIATAILFVLAWFYSVVLEVFVSMVANGELSSIFSAESIGTIIELGKYAVPINFLVDVFVATRPSAIIYYLAISGGIFILGLAITVFTFHYVRNAAIVIKPARLRRQHKVRSVAYALVKKEFSLITRNPDYIYSFSGLLIIQPFLLYLVVLAMNTVFGTGTFLYYTSLFPNFVSIVDVFLVMMFTVIISAGANQYIAMEERTVKNLKTIPVSVKLQMLIKLIIPFAMSEASLLVSVTVLWIAGSFSFLTALFAFILSSVLLLIFNIISLCEELKIRHGKPRSSGLSTIYSYLLPLLYAAVSIYLAYVGAPLWQLYFVGIAVFLILGLPHFIILNRKMGDWFMELEATN